MRPGVLRRVDGVARSSGHAPAARLRPDRPARYRQWYAVANRAYDAWPTLPPLAPVRVAVIDSGVDLGHPDLAAAGSCWPRASSAAPHRTRRGHGTIVAGIIAAELDNATGIAGLAPAAELIVAKVVGPAGTISVEAEANAIRWAVDNGARIVNISLGGPPRSAQLGPRHVLAARGGGDPRTQYEAAR